MRIAWLMPPAVAMPALASGTTMSLLPPASLTGTRSRQVSEPRGGSPTRMSLPAWTIACGNPFSVRGTLPTSCQRQNRGPHRRNRVASRPSLTWPCVCRRRLTDAATRPLALTSTRPPAVCRAAAPSSTGRSTGRGLGRTPVGEFGQMAGQLKRLEEPLAHLVVAARFAAECQPERRPTR